MATSLWSSIIISFFVGLFVGSAIYSNISASLLTTVSDCVEECSQQNVTDISVFAETLQKSTSTFGFLSDVHHLIDSKKLVGLGRGIMGYLSSINYSDNIMYGFQSSIRYMAIFDAVGSMEHNQLALKSLRESYNNLPGQAMVVLRELANVPSYVYNSLPVYATILHDTLVVVSRFGAIGSPEHYTQAYQELREMAHFAYQFNYHAAALSIVSNGVQAIGDGIKNKSMAFKDQTVVFLASVNWLAVVIVLVIILILAAVTYRFLTRYYLKVKANIERFEEYQKKALEQEQKKAKKVGKRPRRRSKKKKKSCENFKIEIIPQCYF